MVKLALQQLPMVVVVLPVVETQDWAQLEEEMDSQLF
jgi:hypothetical protein